METILNLLKDKNYHLQKFYQMNETELMNFTEGCFDNLEVFYQSRETILDLVRCIDDLIEQTANGEAGAAGAAGMSREDASDQQRAEMLRLMNQKNDVVQRILAQDLQILSVIESAKSNIIRELRGVQTARKAINGYRAPDVKLDEEA